MLKVTTRIVGAGVTLALLFNGTAMAQMVPSGSPEAATAALNRTPAPPPRPSGQQRTPEDIARNRAIADQYGLPTDVLTTREDDWGRYQPRTIEDTIREIGPEGALLAAQDDAMFCQGFADLDAIDAQIRAADAEMEAANRAVAEARTRAERLHAEARQGRARTNLGQWLLLGLRVGLVSLIPGVGWAYGGYILGTEASALLDRRQHNRELDANDAFEDLYLAQNTRHELVLRRIELRIQRSDRQGKFWEDSMRRWCGVMQPYHARLLTTSATYTPAPAPAATGEHH